MKAPLIILCPMRSLSSWVTAMLGQHPDCYAVPELNLFASDSVDVLMEANSEGPHALHGLLRTLAQLHDEEQSDAAVAAAGELLQRHRHWSTTRLFNHIAETVAPAILVEKSPRTSMQPQSLRRAHAIAPVASFLQLTRHPRAVVEAMHANLAQAGTRPRRLDPEKIRLRSHENINEFASSLPLAQCMRLRVEDLLGEPQVYLPQLAEWLDIDDSADAIAAMLQPENWIFSAPGPQSAPLGSDSEFQASPGLDALKTEPRVLEGDLPWSDGHGFGDRTLKIAREMGYS